MGKSLFKRDLFVEGELAKYMDSSLYANGMFTKHERTTDMDKQHAGSDIVISIPSYDIYDSVVDEKGQLSEAYINRPLNTFAFEIAYKNKNGKYVPGWFIKDDNITEYYLFQWVHKADDNKFPSSKDFHKVEFALVSKKSIYEYLESMGMNDVKHSLLEKAKQIIESSKEGQHYKVFGKPYWFHYSLKFAEEPINMVINKETITKLSVLHGCTDDKQVNIYTKRKATFMKTVDRSTSLFKEKFEKIDSKIEIKEQGLW